MMDRAARRQLALLIRQYLSGAITNFEYDDAAEACVVRTNDAAMSHVYRFFWHFYCDITEHRATDKGRQIPADHRRVIARCILLLRSDAAAAQPRGYLLKFLFGTRFQLRPRLTNAILFSQVAHWPFSSQSDFDSARVHPTFLAGSHAA